MQKVLKFKDLSITIKGTTLFTTPDISLEKGLYALVGRNGTGKTTFLNSVLANRSDFSGSINYQGKEISDYSKEELAKEIAVVFTKPQIFGNHSVKDILTLGRLPYQNLFAKSNEADIAKINEVIEMLDLKTLVNREFNSLSDGEKQMVMIGRALVQDTNILILDEPGAFLDIVNRYRLIEILKKVSTETDKLILFSTHHVDMLEKYCDGLLLILDNEMKLCNDNSQYQSIIQKAFDI